jgi:dTDP-4-dehydrorhamnose 3,5-epimerase
MDRVFTETAIKGLFIAAGTAFADARGFFSKIFDQDEFSLHAQKPIAQVNYSITRGTGTVRGLHFQKSPHMEWKIVTCLEGEIFDVAVDLREDSPTFLQWHGENLKGGTLRSMVIPEGMAHGFQVLSSEAHLIYLHSERYHPESEGRLHAEDPVLNITWPTAVRNLSSSDAQAPKINLNGSKCLLRGSR